MLVCVGVCVFFAYAGACMFVIVCERVYLSVFFSVCLCVQQHVSFCTRFCVFMWFRLCMPLCMCECKFVWL